MQQVSEELVAQAQAGDATAQLKLGLSLLSQRQFQGALQWLHKAAEQKVARAADAIGMLLLTGQGVQRNPELAFEYFRSAALAGDAQALYRCAELMLRGIEVNQDLPGALACLSQSARRGYPLALRAVALLSLATGKREFSRNVLTIAAWQQDPHSQYLLAKITDDTAEAMHWYGMAANAGLHLAKQKFAENVQLNLEPKEPERPDLAAMLQTIQHELEQLDWPELPDVSRLTLSTTPTIWKAENFMSELEAEYLIHQSAPMLEPALVIDDVKQSGRHQHRTGDMAALGHLNLDFAVNWLNLRVNQYLNLLHTQAEPAATLRYSVGQEYKLHMDTLPPDSDLVNSAAGGQRVITALVYLNDNFVGGATLFPKLELEITPKQGQLLVFHNCDADGHPESLSVHAGAPVEQGDKWVLSRWFRQFELRPSKVKHH